jgi:hypothetical protein
MGRLRQPGGPHAEGRCVRVGLESTAGEAKTLLPLTARIRGETERRPRVPPAPPGERPGVRGAIQPGLPTASLQKGARQANRERQATNPIGVFSSSSPSFAPRRREEGRHRAAPEGGGREPAGDEEPGTRRTTTGVNTYPAYVHLSTEPATTTPPPHREHRPATLISSLLWSSSCDESSTSRRVTRYCLPGCWPSSRRTVVPRRMELLDRSCS